MKISHSFAAISLLVTCLSTSHAVSAEPSAECQNYNLYVMRHLPKVDSDNKDPELSEAGHKLALQLSELDFMAQIDVAFSTDYQRTKQTIEPSAKRFDFAVNTYEPRDFNSLIKTIHEQYCGKTIAIIGHSNTVPSIVTAAGGQFSVSFAGHKLHSSTQVQLDESDYGGIFYLSLNKGVVEQSYFSLIPAE